MSKVSHSGLTQAARSPSSIVILPLVVGPALGRDGKLDGYVVRQIERIIAEFAGLEVESPAIMNRVGAFGQRGEHKEVTVSH